MQIPATPRWRHGWLPRCVGVCCFVLFCLLIQFSAVIQGTLSPEKNIRGKTPADLFPTFLMSSVELLDILAKGSLTFVHAVKRWRRGKCAGVLVRLRRHGLRTPLPGIFLSKGRSLCNKLDELQLLVGKNFSSSSVLCFMETWLCGLIPAARLPTLYTQLSGKTKGGGINNTVLLIWNNFS